MVTPSFFEGPEKKLEVVVTPGFPSLRSFGDATWQSIVEAAGAKVISVMRGEYSDAYLLSESSLFVFDDWFVLITCGRTALVDAVPVILRSIPIESIAFLVYERKNEHFPERQATTFYDDVQRLRTMVDGRALCFGDEHGRYVQMFHSTRTYMPEKNDPTLEILMHAIDERTAAKFAPGAAARPSIGVSSGIGSILPGFATSEHVFEPSGYSLNAIRGEEYYTVHVTPEPTSSYVSFETNYDFRGDLPRLVGAVVGLFRPRAFDVVTFLPGEEPTMSVPAYHLEDHVVATLGGYRASYFQYVRPPSGPRPAREVSPEETK